MKNALEYLVLSKLRDEIMTDVKDYQIWEMIFPKGFKDVVAKASKSTNMGKMAATKLLSYYADEWRDDPDKKDFVRFADKIAELQRKRDEDSHKLACDMYNAISLYPKESSREWHVKKQLVTATLQTISQAKALIAKLSTNHSDPWLEGYRGFGFLFDPAFKDGFIQILRRDYAWKADDSVYVERLISDINTCEWMYTHEELSADKEIQLLTSLFAVYLAVCLVGPGSFVYLLGYEPRSETLRDEPYEIVPAKKTYCYQLQPVVFTSFDIYSYYTDDMKPIRFHEDDILRFGRSHETSNQWLGEHRAVVVQDAENRVSRIHAEMRHIKGKGWFLTDMGTPNGTTVLRAYGGGAVYCNVRSSEIERSVRINTGDVFFLGPSANSRANASGRSFVDVGVRNKAFRFERIIE